jgi:predicted nucleic acid-binding protein
VTRVKVVDASAIGAVLFDEPNEAEVARLLRGASLVAPYLLPFELANIAWKKARREPQQAMLFSDALVQLTKLSISYEHVDPAAVYALARETGLTAYDASYLALARTLNAELVSLDAKLLAAAQ